MTPVETIVPFGDDDGDGSAPTGDASFAALDPGRDDPGYWDRFQERTLGLLEPELARRRRSLEGLTVSDVVTSWSRTVVPLAMAAAAVAVMVLWNQPADPARVPDDASTVVEASPMPARPVEDGEDMGDVQDEVDREPAAPTPALDGGTLFTLEEPGPADVSVTLMASVEGF